MSTKCFFTYLFLFGFSFVALCKAQMTGFTLCTNSPLKNYTPTYLGNGNIGVSSSQSGTRATYSYMAWVYEHFPGDVARNAALPAWNEVNFYDGKNWLNNIKIVEGQFENYHQSLDMYNGVLSTSYVWIDHGKATEVSVTLFVSRQNPNLAVIKFEVKPNYSGMIRVLFPIIPWPNPHRMKLAKDANIKVRMVNKVPNVWYPGHMIIVKRYGRASLKRGTCWVVSKPEGDTTLVAIVSRIAWSRDVIRPKVITDSVNGGVAVEINFPGRAGDTYKFYKYVGIVSSKESPNPLNEALIVSKSAAESGYEELLTQHEDEWHKLWKTDVIVKGDDLLQSVIRSSMFYLLCSIRNGSNFGIPPMGLSSDGYYGHIFWDSDTWMFPPLLLLHPDLARSMVMFRYKVLAAAMANARLNGYKGAMYPWESDENGSESCPKFAYQNALYENHVTGDVAFAQWQYFLATGDTIWLARFGYPVIKETADFWKSRVSYDPEKDRYNIKNVVSVDEGLIGVNNDSYTNLVAKRNLEIAAKASRILNEREDPAWRRIAERIYIPYDSLLHCYLTYENAPPSSLGRVVPLLYYPLELNVPDDVKVNDLKNALDYAKKNGAGVMMGITLYQIVAAEVQNRNLYDEFYKISYMPYIREPFNVFAETPESMSTNFLTGAGGFLQQVLFGYTGLRITDQGLIQKYQPMVPQGVREIIIKGIHYHGKNYNVFVKDGKTEMRVE
ncbi:MAG: hypothetical protein ACP5US_07980 [Candidatus Kryptoniota bacterium]